LGPHDDVLVLAAALLVAAAVELAEVDEAAAAPLLELLLELLLPHPARATSASADSNASPARMRGTT
jgi:hypothetical protein